MYKIWRYYKAPYDHTPDMVCSKTIETVRGDEIYSDEVLSSLAENGFNGIWLDAHLYDLVRHDVFPEFGEFAELHIAALNRLIAKCEPYNIKVFLCMQPGRGVSEHDKEFWKNHAGFAGSRYTMHTKSWGARGDTEYTDLVGICTAHEPVKRYFREAFAELGKALPGLGGCILLTGSEFQSHCVTFKVPDDKMCPICAKRDNAEIISEVINLAAAGLHSTNKSAEIIAWDWGWTADPMEVISRISQDVILMPNFESGITRDICGHKDITINEYSLGYAGPSPRMVRESEAADKRSMRWMARLQIGTTHEMGTVSNLPVMKNLFAKAEFMRNHQSAGFMGCWNFGNMFSANTTAFNYFLSEESPRDCREALKAFAKLYFENADVEKTADAWELLSDIMSDNFPFDNTFMYAGPIPWAAGYFSPPGPMQGHGGLSFTTRMGNDRGDDILQAFESYTIAELVPWMEKLADGAEKAADMLKDALKDSKCRHAAEELSAIYTAACSYRSAANLMKIVVIKQEQGEAAADNAEYLAIQRNELSNVEKLLPFAASDPRQGFHPEARAYFFDAARLQNKIARLKELLNIK